MTTNAFNKLINKVEDFGLAYIRLSKNTEWSMNTVNKLRRYGYFVEEVYTVYEGREFAIYK